MILSDLICCYWSSYFLQLGNALMLKAPKCHAMNWVENSIAESPLWLFDLGKACAWLKAFVLSLSFF